MKTGVIRSAVAAAGRPAVLAVAAVVLFTVYFRLAWPFLILILYLSYLLTGFSWTWLSLRFMTAGENGLPDNVFAGDPFSWEFRFANRRDFPLTRCGLQLFLPTASSCDGTDRLTYSIQAQDELPGSSEQGHLPFFWNRGTVQYAWFPSNRAFSVRLRITAGQRGHYYLPAASFFAGDPSGLYQGFRQSGQDRYLSVFPRPLGATGIQRILSFEENRREDPYGLEDRYENVGIRNYQDNDPLKSINWYATAKTNTLKTNLYQRKDTLCCLVVFDMASPYQPVTEPGHGRAADPRLENAINFACGLALAQLEAGARTAFITNAPVISWEKKKSAPPGSPGMGRKRDRQITYADFADSAEQGGKILRLCAAIDDTARANRAEQEKMWARIRQIPPNTLVYLIGYHNPPDTWKGFEPSPEAVSFPPPARFYTPQRLAELPSSRVRLLDLSKGGWTE